VLLSWVLVGGFIILARAFATGPATDELLRPQHIVAAIAFAPLVAVFAIAVSMAISARTSDVRVAQQLAGLATIPMFLMAFILSYNVLKPNVTVYALAGVVLLILDRLAWGLMARWFDRERLLTRFGR
jgi:ABC-type Na+ efflux pump permease subunit